MLNQRNLYRIAAAIELITGVTLLLLPGFIVQILFQAKAIGAEPYLAQLYGLALIGLGVACWSQPCPMSAQRGITIYNVVAAVFLFALIAKAISGGLMVLAAASLHLVLGALMIIDQLKQRSI